MLLFHKITGEKKILPSDQIKLIEQAKFTYFPSGKALEKQTKTIEDQGKKQIKAIENHLEQLVESNELIQNDFSIRIVHHMKNKENIKWNYWRKVFWIL